MTLPVLPLSLAVIALMVVGCREPERPAVQSERGAAPEGHHHPSLHGGTAVELGAHEFQLDVVFTAAEGLLQCYVMDGHMANFVRIPAPALSVTAKLPSGETTLTLLPMANHATGEKVGDTSLFQAQADTLKGVAGFDAVLKEISIRGRNYSNIVLRLGAPGAVAPAKP